MNLESAVTATRDSDRHLPLIEKACAYLDERAGEPVTLAELAAHVGLSPWHLQRLFKKVMGVSPRDYGDARRAPAFAAASRPATRSPGRPTRPATARPAGSTRPRSASSA